MSELATISQVSKAFGVSTRMLRYYEKAGLLQSTRLPGYAYRVYDEAATARLRQIILLRKLRIPIKEIGVILQSESAVSAIEVFERNVEALDKEMQALAVVRGILMRLLLQLEEAADLPLHHLLTSNDAVLAAVDTLAVADNTLKTNGWAEELQAADETLSRLTDVRIVTLPPATVAAAHYIGDEPETRAREMMDAFVKQNRLWEQKPDLRHYGFNHPNPSNETGAHGYEIWVTIPPDMDVPAPLAKKQFAGGLYAAHMIAFGNFNEWEALLHWVTESDRYQFAGDFADQQHMCGLLDEHLNYVAHAQQGNTEPADTQIDLLMPVRLKGETA